MAQEPVRLGLLGRITIKKEIAEKRDALAKAWQTMLAIGETPDGDSPSMRPYNPNNISDADLVACRDALQGEWDKLSAAVEAAQETAALNKLANTSVASVQRKIETSERSRVAGSDHYSDKDSKRQRRERTDTGYNTLFRRPVTIGPKFLAILNRAVRDNEVKQGDDGKTRVYTTLEGDVPLKAIIHSSVLPHDIVKELTGELNVVDMWLNPVFRKEGFKIVLRADGKGETVAPWREYVVNFRYAAEQYRGKTAIATIDLATGGFVELMFVDDTIGEARKYVDELRRAVQDYGQIMVRTEHAAHLEIPLQVQVLEEGVGPTDEQEPAAPTSSGHKQNGKVHVSCTNPNCKKANGRWVHPNQVGNTCRDCQSGTLQSFAYTPTEETSSESINTTTEAPAAATA